jgi:hypothetical protein
MRKAQPIHEGLKMTLHKIVGGKIPPKEHRKLVTEDAVSDMIDRTMRARSISVKGSRSDCLFLPKDFGPMWVSPLLDNDTLFSAPEDVNSPDICWPMRIGKLSYSTSKEFGREIRFNYWQTVDGANLRGKYKFVGRKNIGFYTGILAPDGEFLSAVEYAGWDGAKWRSCRRLRYNEAFIRNVRGAGMAPVQMFSDTGEDDVGIQAALGQSIALTMRYEWGAQFSIPNSPKVIVPTTPRGILELFNDRDKPEDRDRRAALRHWVSQHIRRAKTGSFKHVPAHLRGEMSFQWRGYDVTIKPSAFDVEQNEKHK